MARSAARVIPMEAAEPQRVSTGVAGLDEILMGGLIPGRNCLLRGGPGAGKTVLGLQFLAAGAARHEKALYITLSEPEAQIRTNAETLSIDLSEVDFLDLSPSPEYFLEEGTYDIFAPSEVEQGPLTDKIIEKIDALKPRRVFLDAITQFKYLSPDTFQFRKQVLSFLRYMASHEATVIISSEAAGAQGDDDVQFMADSIIDIETFDVTRRIRVKKFRGSDFRSGLHDFVISDRGIQVFPQLLPEEHTEQFELETISSGIPELDEMLHGGIERGTVTIITGPSGVGKTTTGLHFMKEAAGRGERSVVYAFEEGTTTFMRRAEATNVPVASMLETGMLSIEYIEPLKYTPTQFAVRVREEIEQRQTKIVMLDSTSGYKVGVRGEDLAQSMHALVKYLANMGVTVILINEVEMITGDFRITDVGISYLADNIMFLRYIEMDGSLHKVVGVLKKRVSDFEKELREISITRYGIKVGQPLSNLRGILVGHPELVASEKG